MPSVTINVKRVLAHMEKRAGNKKVVLAGNGIISLKLSRVFYTVLNLEPIEASAASAVRISSKMAVHITIIRTFKYA